MTRSGSTTQRSAMGFEADGGSEHSRCSGHPGSRDRNLSRLRILAELHKGTRCYYLSRTKLVEDVLALITADHPVIRKARKQIDREKAKDGKEKVAGRG